MWPITLQSQCLRRSIGDARKLEQFGAEVEANDDIACW